MGQRGIFNEVSIGKLQQGYIFNNAVCENYIHSEVYGIIITPRCDIENEKVMTFHYLPIVSLEDWKLNDFWFLLKRQLIRNLNQNINQIFKDEGISTNLLEVFSKDEILLKFEPKIHSKKVPKFKSYINWLKNIEEQGEVVSQKFLDEVLKEKSFFKIGANIIKDLTQNNMREFYLIEDWSDNDKYKVVLLREVQKFSWHLGKKIAQGLICEEFEKKDFNYNDLKYEPEGFIYPIKAVKSPFIEHMIQKFFTNFGRIGITDHEFQLELKLIT